LVAKSGSIVEMAKPSAVELNQEMGVRLAGMPFAEAFDVSGKSFVLGRTDVPSVKQLTEMRRQDGQARALFRLLTMPARAAAKRATWIPADGGDKEAEFITQLYTLPAVNGGMKTPFTRVVSQMLLATVDGFSPFELVYTRPKKGPLKGKYTLDKIAYRPSDTVSFVVTEQGDYDGFKQRTVTPNGKVIDEKIDPKNSIYYACSEEENPFYGVSYFNAAFYHYDKKIKLYYLAHLAAQHRAVGSRLGKYPKNAHPNELLEFRRGLADFGLAQSMTVPDTGWSVEDLGKSLGDFPFMDFINHHNSQMSKSVLAPFLDDQQGGGSPLVSFGGPNDSMYLVLVNVIIAELEAVFNDWLTPRFVDWNFGNDKFPKLKFGPFSEEQKEAIKTTFDKLSSIGTGANVTRKFLLELEKYMAGEMGLDIEYEALDKALDKQTDETLKFFMEGQGPPLMEPPFQPTPTVPADQQPGVPAAMQFIPGKQPGTPGGAPAALPPGGTPALPPGGSAPKSLPALPSQLSAGGVPSARAWLDPGLLALSSTDQDAVTSALSELGV
jgi:hypothetical protein